MERLVLTYYDFYQGLLTVVVLITGLLIALLIGARSRRDIAFLVPLYLWHTFFSLYYWYFSLSNTADATLYYQKSLTLELDFSPGTRFLESLTAIISKLFYANYLNTTLVFGIFGIIGMTYLYLSLKPIFLRLKSIWYFILFLPSMSFWSAGLGKDALAFLATCLFLYAFTRDKSIGLSAIIAFFIMFMVRPHIALVMLVSYVIYFIIRARVHIVLKFLTMPVLIGVAALTFGFVQQYLGLQEVSLSGVDAYIDKRQSYNLRGGSSLDIASMSYPEQVFTYIFRPLPFEAHNALALLTSLENVIVLLLFLYVLIKQKFRISAFIEHKNLLLLVYAFLACSILAMTTANLGIATRQKWMFMPVLLYLLIYAFYKVKSNRYQEA